MNDAVRYTPPGMKVNGHYIIGKSPAMERLYDLIEQVAKSSVTVLMTGESGTGKEMIAEALHIKSGRLGKFVPIHVAAYAETLLPSELFGHERGSFTGAEYQKKGRFEIAHNGTAFLDEVATIDPHLQVRLLRVLQEKSYERVGGNQRIEADFRLIAATNQDLEELTSQGKFREDFYYRLNVVPIRIPPLRERVHSQKGGHDILQLVDFFVRKYGKRELGDSYWDNPLEITDDVKNALLHYSWPGNVRELENVIERAVVLGKDQKKLTIGNLMLPKEGTIPVNAREYKHQVDAIAQTMESTDLGLETLEIDTMRRVLDMAGWNVARAARILKLTTRTLQYRVEKYRLKPDEETPNPQ